MGEVTILFRNFKEQPVIINANTVVIRRDIIQIETYSENKVYFKDVVKSITADKGVRIFIK